MYRKAVKKLLTYMLLHNSNDTGHNTEISITLFREGSSSKLPYRTSTSKIINGPAIDAVLAPATKFANGW